MSKRVSWKSLLALTILAVFVGTGFTASANSGITIHSGTLKMNGNDIVDGGTTIWDASNNYIPKNSLQNLAASDVGLGNVQNEAQVAENGDSMTGTLDMDNNTLDNVGEVSSGFSYGRLDFATASTGQRTDLYAAGDINLIADSDGSFYKCYIDASDSGSWNCDGTKNWMHKLNATHTAFYTSQESPQVRAVYEGKTHVTDSKKIDLPDHFSKTVSDSKPMLRAQVTPQGTLTNAAVMNKTEDYLQIKVGKETDVNYRITGIRDGYEDKEIVRRTN